MSSKSENTIAGIFLVALLLGGIILMARRPTGVTSPVYLGKVKKLPIVEDIGEPEESTRRYRNKEIRKIEYNADGLPTLIEITRDYAIA
jgi:hypothetical protein